MRELEFHVVELIEETAPVKLEDNKVVEEVVEEEGEGSTATTILSDVVLIQQYLTNEHLLQAFGLTDNKVFANTTSAMGFSLLRNQNHPPLKEDGGDLMEFLS